MLNMKTLYLTVAALHSRYIIVFCNETYGSSHLHFVDRIVDFLAPHRDAPLVVSVDPAILTETLRLEAGKRLVVRNSHSLLSRHGR